MWHRSFSTTPDQLTKKKWDALVISGGYNSLVAAAYLARGSLSVAVLERCHVIGRAAMTEEIVPGFKFSRCSYVQGLIRPCIISLKFLMDSKHTHHVVLQVYMVNLAFQATTKNLQVYKVQAYGASNLRIFTTVGRPAKGL
ncbi:unnamed protein product [Brassica rapa]|uniref:FAD/NAD(P)-binding domain-containing protein n=2 Tax=Brassica TaxID=3705 RepID=A0A3P5ZJ38_BRACM|nr:unnamed protein product [Brassica napus]CAG7888116.1 unnamed protein product [Brassica rapa]CDY22891.1 BnaA01g18290D [Brassica napus]VDC75574.1 unnamed protein product [Brassica rapa]